MNRKYTPNRPEHWWEYLPAFLGFPVRAGQSRIAFPWLTYLLIAITCIISILAWSAPNFSQIVKTFGMTPATLKSSWGLTLITSFFLHANLMHLVGNMYFLALFGGKTEQALGRFNYFLLILGATLVGHAAHIFFDPRATVTTIGASGGISGVIVYYCLKYPRDQFYQWISSRFIRVSALAYMGAWILLQFGTADKQIAGATNVSSLAHLGGALVGLVCALTWTTNFLPQSQKARKENHA